MIGILYFFVILIANTIGAISGMGGGVLIKPIFDFIGADSVASVSFFSTVAVFTMSFVSTLRHLQIGTKINPKVVIFISVGAVLGGILGNSIFEIFLSLFVDEGHVLMIQIILTILTLIFAFFYNRNSWINYQLNTFPWYILCGLILGFLASFLGIGGGPINVSLLMIMFSFPIKEAVIYSISTIFFSQFSKILTILFTTGFERYDLKMLWFIIPAAILGGILGARLSNILSEKRIALVFQIVIVLVILINIYNGLSLLG